jgi:hypothetical protein
VIHWNLGPKVACAPHSKTIVKRHVGLGFLSSSSPINLLFITVHADLYEDLIPYVHVAHDLESLVRSTAMLYGTESKEMRLEDVTASSSLIRA